ncbi:MAG: RNA polymerase-binding protein DksA [Epsilonproteobacteria bacterium]|nr:RNA polymerase-binding protein DksA [Campylobacterota bacterium]
MDFKQALLDRKEEIIKILNSLKEDMHKIDSCEIKEEIDFANNSINAESSYILYNQLQHELLEIEEALSNIEKGVYGICQMCEEPINPERLKIKPFAKYCITCREIIEKNS